MSPPFVWLTCAHPGCAEVIVPDRRHVENLTAAPWRCPRHRRKEK